MSQETVSMTFFTDCFTENFFFTRQCVSIPLTVFLIWTCNGKSMFSLLINIFWWKHTSPYTLHILQQILHGLHFSVSKNLIIDFWSSLEHSVLFATILNRLKRNIFMRLKYLLNQFQTFQCLHLWKKFWDENCVLFFFPKISLIYWTTLIYIYSTAHLYLSKHSLLLFLFILIYILD